MHKNLTLVAFLGRLERRLATDVCPYGNRSKLRPGRNCTRRKNCGKVSKRSLDLEMTGELPDKGKWRFLALCGMDYANYDECQHAEVEQWANEYNRGYP